jgi:predicted dehydrogenase
MTHVDTALVVGCGSIGTRHARNLSSVGVDVSLYDTDRHKSNTVATQVDGVTYGSLTAGLRADPDVVFVTTPSNHHISPAQRAAAAGCDLFIEKPLSNTEEGVKALIETIERRNLTTMIGSNMRFHPAIETAKQLLDDNRIGRVVSARIEGGSYLPDWHPEDDYREMYSAKAGVGGALLDYIHEINYAQWLFGEITTVSAMVGESSALEIETEDTAALISRTTMDTLVEFHLDYIQRPYSRSYHTIGEEGTIRWEWGESSVRRYDPQDERWITESAWPDWETDQMYRDEIEHFLSCVESGTKTRSPVADGYRDLEAALAAKESGSTGKQITI